MKKGLSIAGLRLSLLEESFDKCPDEKGIKHTRWRKK